MKWYIKDSSTSPLVRKQYEREPIVVPSSRLIQSLNDRFICCGMDKFLIVLAQYRF